MVSEGPIVHRTIRVYGHVQGVFYRQSTKRHAVALGLVGYARNLEDGSVLIDVEGEAEAIDRLVDWCRVGPPAAQVERVESIDGEVVGYHGFETM